MKRGLNANDTDLHFLRLIHVGSREGIPPLNRSRLIALGFLLWDFRIADRGVKYLRRRSPRGSHR
jgi:hypothetical protein